VLALPHRREYLDEIRKKRGEDAYQALRNEMLSLQDAARRAAEPLFDEV